MNTNNTSPVPSNKAVWLPAKHAQLVLETAPYTSPRENEIVVKNRAVAINPNDWLTQSMGSIVLPWTKYPFVLGSDVAGVVVEVGSAVSRFKVGDRVLGHAVAADKKRNNPAEGGFQEYTVLLENMAAPIPDTLSFENAVVLPLGLSTAASGLFQKDQLALQHPSAQPKPTGKVLLIWGGSTSVGSNAIQLAVAAGYEVITTASPKNFDYVRSLGATQVFDYRSRTAVRDIIASLRGRQIAGALALGVGSAEACLDIVHASRGAKAIALATPSVSFENAPLGSGRMSWLIPTMARLIGVNIALMAKARMRGIRVKYIFGTSLMENEVSRMIYGDFLPGALAKGSYAAVPAPSVFGHGLERIPAAVEAQKHGVSARKLVVTL
jgi:NADPH:quinone reductase-like Zn-dependent oxidoreductase